MRRPGDHDNQVALKQSKLKHSRTKSTHGVIYTTENEIGMNYNELGRKFNQANCAPLRRLIHKNGRVVYLIVKQLLKCNRNRWRLVYLTWNIAIHQDDKSTMHGHGIRLTMTTALRTNHYTTIPYITW